MKALKWLVGLAFVLLAVSVLVRTYSEVHQDSADERGQEQTEATKTPSRVSVINGRTVVTLDAAAQRRLGIEVAPLPAVSSRQEAMAPATVLSVQPLISMRDTYVATQSQLAKAQASAEASGEEYQRQKALFQENQNTSRKSLQAAEAIWRTDQASVDAARQQLRLERAAAQQSWGGILAGWLVDGSPALERLLDQRAWPVQVTLPPGDPFTDPPRVTLSTPAGRSVDARYVSLLPQVDPRIQGISLLYVAPSRPGLAAGMNLVARLSAGRRLTGAVAPRSAVVWRDGQAWVYEQITPTQFIRQPVSTDDPLRGGFFVDKGLSPGDKVVVIGPQMLLSTEFSSQSQAQGEGHND